MLSNQIALNLQTHKFEIFPQTRHKTNPHEETKQPNILLVKVEVDQNCLSDVLLLSQVHHIDFSSLVADISHSSAYDGCCYLA